MTPPTPDSSPAPGSPSPAPKSRPPLLSIVVPAYNEAKLLAAHLRRIREAMVATELAPDVWDLIVCDNNSSDNTAEIAKASGAEVVFEAHNQIAKARNTGAKAARGKWLLFIDADSHPSPELMGELTERIQQEGLIGAGAVMKMVGGPWWFRLPFTFGCNMVMRASKMASGAFLLVERAGFEKIGGFNESLYAAEELELVKRLKDYGKTQGKSFHVFHQHPFHTSGRKGDLYGWKTFLKLFASFAFSPVKTLRNPKHLSIWYDGKR